MARHCEQVWSSRCGAVNVRLRELPEVSRVCRGRVAVEAVVTRRHGGIFWAPDEPLCVTAGLGTAAEREQAVRDVVGYFEVANCGGGGAYLGCARRRRRHR